MCAIVSQTNNYYLYIIEKKKLFKRSVQKRTRREPISIFVTSALIEPLFFQMSKIANLFYIREMYYATYSIKINITLMNVYLNAAVIFKGNGSYEIEKKKNV